MESIWPPLVIHSEMGNIAKSNIVIKNIITVGLGFCNTAQ